MYSRFHVRDVQYYIEDTDTHITYVAQKDPYSEFATFPESATEEDAMWEVSRFGEDESRGGIVAKSPHEAVLSFMALEGDISAERGIELIRYLQDEDARVIWDF